MVLYLLDERGLRRGTKTIFKYPSGYHVEASGVAARDPSGKYKEEFSNNQI